LFKIQRSARITDEIIRFGDGFVKIKKWGRGKVYWRGNEESNLSVAVCPFSKSCVKLREFRELQANQYIDHRLWTGDAP
jgi:hypothetical protein